MKRAVELFRFEELPSSSPHLHAVWRTASEPDPADRFVSVAVTHWEMVVTRQPGGTWLSVRGPETQASLAPIPADAEFFGLQFELGTYMPQLDMRSLVDSGVDVPIGPDARLRLDGSDWEMPTADNGDVFVERLARAGLLVHDPVVVAALHDDVAGLSTRSVERRVTRATGLTRGTIRQIRRAEQAVALLEQGVPALEVARRAGYTDQPHMTRSLKRFVGQTPSRIVAGS
jgi:AraC-like DNA-binding protein